MRRYRHRKKTGRTPYHDIKEKKGRRWGVPWAWAFSWGGGGRVGKTWVSRHVLQETEINKKNNGEEER